MIRIAQWRRPDALLTIALVVCAVAAGVVAAIPSAFGVSRWAALVPIGIAALIGAVGAQLQKKRDAQEHRYRVIREHAGGTGGHLPRVGHADPFLLGVHPSRGGNVDASLTPYVMRGVDDELRSVLHRTATDGGFVLVVGPSASGKSRAAFEAVRALLDDWRLCVPARSDSLAAIIAAEINLRRTVIWLKDLQDVLADGGLSADLLRRMLEHRPTVLVGTIWDTHLERYRPVAEPSVDFLADQLNRQAWEVLEQSIRVDMPTVWSEGDWNHAAKSSDPRIQDAVSQRRNARSLSEYVAAAPALWERWTHGRGAEPIGAAIVDAAIDCARAGLLRPIPEPLLRVLYWHYLADEHDRARANADTFADGLRWALERIYGASSLLAPRAAKEGQIIGYVPFDYLIDHMERTETANPVPDRTWAEVLSQTQPSDSTSIGYAAYMAGRLRDAIAASRIGAELGEPTAMTNLGVFLDEAAESIEAEPWLRSAADAGGSFESYNLAVFLEKRGHVDEAEAWYQQAIEAGSHRAMSNLGLLLWRRGDAKQAEDWLRRSVDSNDSTAMSNLGVVLAEQGHDEEAADWFSRAAGLGSPIGMWNLGKLYFDRGERREGEHWIRRAAAAGHPDATSTLAAISHDRGDVQAERWYRSAADLDDVPSMLWLAELLRNRGDAEETERWLRRAAELGSPAAMCNLAILADERSDSREAERWYRTAAEAGFAGGMVGLGVVLALRGRDEEAEDWFRSAANAGDSDAMFNLGLLLERRGELSDAEVWYREGAERGQMEAIVNLGASHLRRGDIDGAENWYQAAARVGDPRGVEGLKEIQRRRGRP